MGKIGKQKYKNMVKPGQKAKNKRTYKKRGVGGKMTNKRSCPAGGG